MFFADEIPTIPVEIAAFLACLAVLMWMFKVGQDIRRGLQPLPPMEQQLRHLEERIMARLDDQDEKFGEAFKELRGHIDVEIGKAHARIDVHGQELYRLKGFVDGIIHRGRQP